jgi:hypothetical protein
MHSQRKMVGPTRFVVPMILAVLTGASCKSKAYPEPDAEALAAWEESMRDAGGLMGAPPPLPARGDENEPGESAPPVTSIDPGGSVGGQSGSAMTPATCTGDAGACGDAGVGPVCVPTGLRDCASDLDNDCDGQPDNVVDDVCVCTLGTPEACDEHPGLDGNGPCRAGLRTCVLGADGRTTEWGACDGSVGPGETDSCTVRGDDADCDGTPNTDCPCVDGDTQQCGSTTDTGPCAIGTSTCVDGRFGACVGAVPPAAQDSCAPGDDSNCNGSANDRFCQCFNGSTQACGVTSTGVCELGTQTCVNGSFGQCVGEVRPASRDCRSQQDNDCNGSPDNTTDNVCRCTIGSTQACQTHPGLDGIGRCRAGSQTCTGRSNNSSSDFNACTGSQGPSARDCRSAQDNDCDGRPDNTIDGVCQCIPGQGNGPCSGDPNNSRCGDEGRCEPCESNADCSLVSGGRSVCDTGRCIQGDTQAPSIPSFLPTVDVLGAGSVLLSWPKAEDNQTPQGELEYGIFHAFESTLMAGAANPERTLELVQSGGVVNSRPFAPFPGGGGGGFIDFVVTLGVNVPRAYFVVLVRDEAGNMSGWSQVTAVF